MKITFEGKDYFLYKYLFNKSSKKFRPSDDDGFEINERKLPFFYYRINGEVELLFYSDKELESDHYFLKKKYSSRPDVIYISPDISDVVSLYPEFYKNDSLFSSVTGELYGKRVKFFEEIQKQLSTP